MRTRQQVMKQGFTLIELMVSISIIGILSAMSIQAFKGYRQKAAYAVVEQTIHDARQAFDAALVEPDATFASVSATVSSAGGLSGTAAGAILPGFVLPRNTKLQVNYATGCSGSACELVNLEIRHCLGDQYQTYTRYGDGQELLVGNISGAGCP